MGSVEESVATDVETQPSGSKSQARGMQLRLLGPLTLYRNGAAVELPKSRKVRALTAYLEPLFQDGLDLVSRGTESIKVSLIP